ncbi:UPF0158 family protein [Salinispira pacifica]
MEFPLTRELIDQIMFGMENQDTEFVLDSREHRVVKVQEISEETDETDEPAEERYLPLPEWHSVDGYNLMEKFVASLHNPIYREILRRILTSGKGVFRQFKDALKERKEIERLWYHFKEREMRARVLEWYNLLRESWGLERVGDPEGEETDALVLTDFTIGAIVVTEELLVPAEPFGEGALDVSGEPSSQSAPGTEEDGRPVRGTAAEIAAYFDALAFVECMSDQPAHLVSYLLQKRRMRLPSTSADSARILVARTPLNELAGFVWADFSQLSDGRMTATLHQIYVLPEFRGLGLARMLFTRLCTFAYEQKAETLFIEMPGPAAFLSDMYETEGAQPLSQLFQLDVTRWYRENVEVPG